MSKAAYLGPHGTFSEAACRAFGQITGLQLVPAPCASITDCAVSVAAGEARFGIVPLENSLAGSVRETLDLLTTTSGLKILAELDLEIEHHLLSQAAALTDIRAVYSHPQALAQCRAFLQQQLAHARTIPVVSTAEAARMAAELGVQAAAIAGRSAAAHYKLPVLAAAIQDKASTTRFIVLGRKEEQLGQPQKTSFLFSVNNTPGNLYRILGAFAKRQINLTRIESRPARSRLGDYIIFVDLAGTPQDSIVKAALEEASRETELLKILGSFPVLSVNNK